MAKSTRMTCGKLSSSMKKYVSARRKSPERVMFNTMCVCAGIMMRDSQLSLMECHADNRVHEVSIGGKKARFKIAKSTTDSPDCMIADVVTSDGTGDGRYYPSNGPIAFTATYRVEGFGIIELYLERKWKTEEGDTLAIKTYAL